MQRALTRSRNPAREATANRDWCASAQRVAAELLDCVQRKGKVLCERIDQAIATADGSGARYGGRLLDVNN